MYYKEKYKYKIFTSNIHFFYILIGILFNLPILPTLELTYIFYVYELIDIMFFAIYTINNINVHNFFKCIM